MFHLPERIHKRPFVVAVIVFVLFTVVSVGMLVAIGFFSSGSNLIRIHVYSSGEQANINGIGLNLSYIPTTNYLENSSFENRQFDQVYTVYEGTENALYALPDSKTDFDLQNGIFVGGTVRVMSINEQGQLVLKLQATVTNFQMDQLGKWSVYEAPIGTKDDQVITSVSSSDRATVVFGKSGLAISDVTSSSPSVLDIDIAEDFEASSCVSERFFAVTATGDFTSSSDGKTWNIFKPDFEMPSSMRTVTSIGNTGIAAGDNGRILLCSDGTVQVVPSGTTENILTSESDGRVIILGCENGQILTTSNGVYFRALTVLEMPAFDSTPSWQCSDYQGGQFVLGGDHGQIALGSYSTDNIFTFTDHIAMDETGNPLNIRDIMMLSTGEIILVNDFGYLFLSKDQGASWSPLSTGSVHHIDAIGLTSSGKIMLCDGVTSYSTQMFTRIEFDELLSESIFQAGDMCFLQTSTPSEAGEANNGSSLIWQVFGDDTSMLIQKKAPAGGGLSSIKMIGGSDLSGEQEHYISQVIFDAEESHFQKSKFYKMEFWLKQEGISNGEVMAWVSGNFTSVGTTFTDVGSGWRQYTYTFVLPDEACSQKAGEIRLNIGFVGPGELSMDRAYLGLDSDQANRLPDSFVRQIAGVEPSLIRLDNLGIGQMDVSSDAWLLTTGNESVTWREDGFVSAGCTSLETSLSLVRSAGGDPWLVIGSSASQSTVENLMAYMCGSISDPIGKIRVENGTAVPWGEQFDRIVIEVSDTNGLFSTDLQKGSYVDYIMNVIKSSSYYYDIKGKIVFVDGMEYDSGTMQSQADYHTSDLYVTNRKQTINGLELQTLLAAVTQDYTAYFDLIPRTPSRPQEAGEEWIRFAELSMYHFTGEKSTLIVSESPITAADYGEMLLSDLGDHTSTFLYNLPVSPYTEDIGTDLIFSSQGNSEADRVLYGQNSNTMLSVCEILRNIVNETSTYGHVGAILDNKVVPLPDGLTAYSYYNQGVMHLVVLNTSDAAISFLIEADDSLNGAIAYRYSGEGKFVQKSKFGRQANRINLLSGQIIIVQMNMA
jgi:hypothetical protein